MSKSTGAILTVSTLKEKGYDPLAFRFMCLNSHYRKQLVFSYDALDQAFSTLKKLRNRISSILREGEVQSHYIASYQNKFKKELEDDLNTANALSVLYEVLKANQLSGMSKLTLIEDFDQVLSLDLIQEKKSVSNEDFILEQIKRRAEAKKSRDFILADKIRDDLLQQGIRLIDGREGTTYEIIDE